MVPHTSYMYIGLYDLTIFMLILEYRHFNPDDQYYIIILYNDICGAPLA